MRTLTVFSQKIRKTTEDPGAQVIILLADEVRCLTCLHQRQLAHIPSSTLLEGEFS